MKKYLGYNLLKITQAYFEFHAQSFLYQLRYCCPNIEKIKKLKKLKDTKKNRNAFVFANGPSVELLDANKILKYKKEGFDVWCVNSYLCSSFSKIVSPTHMVLSDPLWIEQRFSAVPERMRQEISESHKRIGECRPILFLPINYHQTKWPTVVHFFNDSENIFSKNILNPAKARGYNSIGGYKALALALFHGYEKIYICGIDNSQFLDLSVDDRNSLHINVDHFYTRKYSAESYRYAANRLIHEQLKIYSQNFYHLHKFPKGRIINLNPNGFVDAFSKKHNLDVYK